MNRTFRLVWNHSQESWTVASEHAKGKTKSGVTGGSRKRSLLALACVLNMAVLEPAFAYTQNVSSGVTVTGETVTGTQNITSGGTANSGIIDVGASQFVSSGGVANDMTVRTSGSQSIYDGGEANGTILRVGGEQLVHGGAIANNTIINQGLQIVRSGGVANGTVINEGGRQELEPGASANDTTINSLGALTVEAGATATNVTQSILGALTTNTDATVRGTNPLGAFFIDASTHSASNVLVDGAGEFSVLSNGTATDTTVVDRGVLNVSSGGILEGITRIDGRIYGDVINHGNLIFNQSINSAFTGALSGTGELTKDGVNTLTLSGTLTYSGGTQVNAGRLQLDNTTLAGEVTGLDGANFDLINGANLNGTINGGLAVTLDAGTNWTLTGDSSIGGLDGSGTAALDAHDLTLNRASGTSEFDGQLTGTGNLVKDGSYTQTLRGNVAQGFTGSTQINAGSLLLDRATLAGAVTIQSGANLDLLGDSSIGGLEGSGTAALDAHDLTLNRVSGTSQFAGQLTGTGNLVKDGSYTQILSGDVAQGFTGSTQVNAGSLLLDGTTLAAAVTIQNGANLDLLGDSSIGGLEGSGTAALDAHDLTLNRASGTSQFAGQLTGTGNLIKDGSYTQTLRGDVAQGFTGSTQVNAGSLLLDGTTLAAAVTIQNGANLDLLGDSSIGGLDGSGTAALGAHDLTLNRASGTSQFAGQLTGTGNLIKDGSYTQTLSGDVAIGSTQINAGSLMLDRATLAGAVTIQGSANLGLLGDSSIGGLDGSGTAALGAHDLTLNRASGRSEFAGRLTGTGNLVKDGSYTQTLRGNVAQGFTGSTQINAGSLRLDGTTLAGAVTIQNGANLDLLGDSSIGGLDGSGTAALGAHDLTLNRASGTSQFAGQLTGTGNLVKDGSYTQIFRGDVAQGLGGHTELRSGVLKLDIAAADAAAFNQTVVLKGGWLDLSDSTDIGDWSRLVLDDQSNGVGGVIGSGDSVYLQDGDFNATIGQPGRDNLYVIKNGSGETVLGGNNTYVGHTRINDGTLTIRQDGALGDTNLSREVVFNGGQLKVDGSFDSQRTLELRQNGALQVTDGNDVTFNGGVLETGGSFDFTKTGNGTLTLSGALDYTGTTFVDAGTLALDNTTLTGNVVGLSGALLHLQNGARLIGSIDPLDVTLESGTHWTMTADSLIDTLNNAGNIDFQAPTGAFAAKRLTVNNLNGNGGLITLNTALGDSSSLSDTLVIDGGTATGDTRLGIRNANGLGDQTTGNGILLVDAVNGATTTTDAFRLNAPVLGGAYEYTLHRDSASQDWFLTSDLVDPGTPGTPDNPGIPDNPGTPGNPGTPDNPGIPGNPGIPDKPGTPGKPDNDRRPNYRAETSLYSVLPSMALDYGNALVGTLHDRRGAFASTAYSDEQRVWARTLAQKNTHNGAANGIYGKGAAYDSTLTALQIGTDLFQRNDSNGKDRAGFYGAIGQNKGSVDHFDSRNAGNNNLTAYSLGVYWTHIAPSGWYLDSVLQATWNEVQAKSANGMDLSTQGLGTAASFEAGMPFDVGGGVVVEPQAQVVYQHIGLDKAHDQAAGVDFGAIDSLQTRLGARVAKTWSKSEQLPVTAWVRPSVVKEFKGTPTTSFSTSTQGEVDFSSDMRGTSLKLDGGVEGQLTESISVNTKVGYEWGISSNTDGDGYSAQVGLTFKF